MKKITAAFVCILVILSMAIPAFAADHSDKLISQTVEYLDNGDYIVHEVFEPTIQSRSTKTGTAVETYKKSDGVSVWAIKVTGTFTYNGSTSSATSSSVTVELYTPSAEFISKNASYSGNTARGTASVKYSGYTTSRTTSLSCDKNGNLY